MIREAQDRFLKRRFGVFNHYLYTIQNNANCQNNQQKGRTDWNECVNELDVGLIARQLKEINAGYYFITVMQGSEFMLAPNSTFDRIAGVRAGECCARRDVISELYDELSKYDIDLYLYYTGDGPYQNEAIGKRFGFTEPRTNISMDFVKNWSGVLEEYAVRYKDKVKGWWIDGCYRDTFGYTSELLKPYLDACLKGNPDALVATNGGLKDNIESNYEGESFVCGEFNDFEHYPKQRFYKNAMAHILAPLGIHNNGIGTGWASTGLRNDGKYLTEYIKKVNDIGGVVSIDIALNRDGSFDFEQLETLKYVGKNIRG